MKFGALVAILPLGGCFTYAAVPMEAASSGLQARLRLDDDGFVRVANQAAMGRYPVEWLDVTRQGIVGRIAEITSTVVRFEMRGLGGSLFTARVPRASVDEVAIRSFSIKNTVLMVAGGVFIAKTFASGVIGGLGGGGGGDDGGPDNAIVSFSLAPFFW